MAERGDYIERKRWGFFGLPFTFTVYSIGEEYLTIDKGLINKTEDDCYIYKITDVKLQRSMFERWFGTGTVICYSSDATDQKIVLEHIKRSKEIKDYILEVSEKARLRRRTMNVQNIGVDVADIDGDGIPDNIE